MDVQQDGGGVGPGGGTGPHQAPLSAKHAGCETVAMQLFVQHCAHCGPAVPGLAVQQPTLHAFRGNLAGLLEHDS